MFIGGYCSSGTVHDTVHRLLFTVTVHWLLFIATIHIKNSSLMDEQAIRLLLKEQYDALHAQIAALATEWQAAKLIQPRPGGGKQGSWLPRFMRLEVPKFNGTEPESWIFVIQEYFDLLQTTDDQRLKVIGFNLEGATAEWFSRPNEQRNAFTSDDITTVVQTNKPMPSHVTAISPNSGKPPLLPTPTESTTNTNTTPLAIKWISLEERKEHLNKGLCFNCDNKWMRGHKCPGKFLLLMAEEGDNPGREIPIS
ncbi:hypothetical protein Tco_1414042 [Tanacetum coccineum]